LRGHQGSRHQRSGRDGCESSNHERPWQRQARMGQ
jgi:hypothetical protein